MCPPDETFADFEGDTIIGGLSNSSKIAIDQYASQLSDVFNVYVGASDDALDNFSNAISQSSTSDTRTDILDTMLSSAVESSIKGFVGGLSKHYPAVKVLFQIFKDVQKELERAAKATASVKLRDFLHDQQNIITSMRDGFDRFSVMNEISLEYASSEDEADVSARILQLSSDLKGETSALHISNEFERTLWERWMIAHFTDFSESTNGCIEVVFDLDDIEDGVDFEGVFIAMPGSMKGKVLDALNRLLADHADLRTPLDFRVPKRIKYENTENLVGGSTTDFGWLDEFNNIAREPFHKDSKRVFNVTGSWISMVRHF